MSQLLPRILQGATPADVEFTHLLWVFHSTPKKPTPSEYQTLIRVAFDLRIGILQAMVVTFPYLVCSLEDEPRNGHGKESKHHLRLKYSAYAWLTGLGCDSVRYEKYEWDVCGEHGLESVRVECGNTPAKRLFGLSCTPGDGDCSAVVVVPFTDFDATECTGYVITLASHAEQRQAWDLAIARDHQRKIAQAGAA